IYALPYGGLDCPGGSFHGGFHVSHGLVPSLVEPPRESRSDSFVQHVAEGSEELRQDIGEDMENSVRKFRYPELSLPEVQMDVVREVLERELDPVSKIDYVLSVLVHPLQRVRDPTRDQLHERSNRDRGGSPQPRKRGLHIGYGGFRLLNLLRVRTGHAET